MPLKTAVPEEPTLNLTPMIDVILTLVIFFMVATRFTDEEKALGCESAHGFQPGRRSRAAPSPQMLAFFLTDMSCLAQQPVSLDELTKQLTDARGQYRKLSVIVRGDRNTTHGRMTEVYDACRAAGISEVAISVKEEKKRR